ncbi:MBL fold metallo-hydrolase [Pseudoalteromonas sp. MMG005]|uniref:MBL fold metallo-hydrolase n=1 Tax=Pseudoalteromonas sp. MMG005 TaxID=2822682 RepID=UPI001B39EFF8|nr:MBL fold metallo-hydrolase [Pseudoalteromonas sp. MMG005]MBQ4845226.1 MBL fold metallo-hydrolase [Pseudoalteromonas sp. MMG005]
MKKLTSAFFIIFTLFLSTHSVSQEVSVNKISNNVYSMFLYHVHSLVVIGDKGVLLTDPANSGRAAELKEEVAKLTSLPITKIVLTHEHYDHVGGTEVFKHAEVYAHRATEPVFRLDVTDQAPKKVHHYLDDKTSLTVGETQVDLLHYGAADGVGMLAVHLPKERVVYSADLYETGAITKGAFIADTNFLGSRILLNSLIDFNPKYAITSHSAELDPQHLKIAAQFYNDLYNEVQPVLLKAMSKGYGPLMQAVGSLPQQVKLPHHKDLGNYNDLSKHVERMVFSIFHGG